VKNRGAWRQDRQQRVPYSNFDCSQRISSIDC
jgi:hypothetical protein